MLLTLYVLIVSLFGLCRYEKIFLPAIKSSNANHPLQGAPIDIEWVWHCHMLAPLAYHKDCEEVIGMIPDHTMLYQPMPQR